MTSSDLAKSVPEAENMCELHKERKVSNQGKSVKEAENLSVRNTPSKKSE